MHNGYFASSLFAVSHPYTITPLILTTTPQINSKNPRVCALHLTTDYTRQKRKGRPSARTVGQQIIDYLHARLLWLQENWRSRCRWMHDRRSWVWNVTTSSGMIDIIVSYITIAYVCNCIVHTSRLGWPSAGCHPVMPCVHFPPLRFASISTTLYSFPSVLPYVVQVFRRLFMPHSAFSSVFVAIKCLVLLYEYEYRQQRTTNTVLLYHTRNLFRRPVCTYHKARIKTITNCCTRDYRHKHHGRVVLSSTIPACLLPLAQKHVHATQSPENYYHVRGINTAAPQRTLITRRSCLLSAVCCITPS